MQDERPKLKMYARNGSPSKPFRLVAERVLNDCKWAFNTYEKQATGASVRVMWVALTTLLRAVGHVLQKVDAESNPKLKKIVESEWQQHRITKPDPKIFWQFIESERNNVVKQYEFGFARSAFYGPPLGQAGIGIQVDLLNVCVGLPPQDFPSMKSEIKDGPFAGQSEQAVAREAIDWWERQLDRILKQFDQS